MLRLILAGALASLGCARPLVFSGWAQIDRPGGGGGVAARYHDRFSHHPFSATHPGCGALAVEPQGPVLVLVPGLRGDGQEFREALPLLAASRPGGLFMFRFGPFEKLERMADDLALGLSRLLACRPAQEVVVLAHSAGGVLISTAVSRVQLPDDSPRGALKVLTVAAPLAGMIGRVNTAQGSPNFFLDLGRRFLSYPSAPAAVRAVHLRTSFPADPVMKPNGDFFPNDLEVGIPDARQINLPAQLGHDEALLHVALKLADGSWRDWFPE
jgi:pimeloyl-ACP methyl ester carboxylesterase